MLHSTFCAQSMCWSTGSCVAGGGGNHIYFLLTDRSILQGLSAALSKYLNKVALRILQEDLLQFHQRFIHWRAWRSCTDCYYYCCYCNFYFIFIRAVSGASPAEEPLGQGGCSWWDGWARADPQTLTPGWDGATTAPSSTNHWDKPTPTPTGSLSLSCKYSKKPNFSVFLHEKGNSLPCFIRSKEGGEAFGGSSATIPLPIHAEPGLRHTSLLNCSPFPGKKATPELWRGNIWCCLWASNAL